MLSLPNRLSRNQGSRKMAVTLLSPLVLLTGWKQLVAVQLAISLDMIIYSLYLLVCDGIGQIDIQ